MGPTIRASRTRRARDAAAQNKLGNRYHDGRGVTKDYTEALRWLHKSADQDDTYAETALGYMYFYGEGAPQDDAQALGWYRKAAEQGYPLAALRYQPSACASSCGAPSP